MKVCLDSRLIKPGEYFVPIKGDSFDGHKFIDEVLNRGAAGIIEEADLYKLAEDKLVKSKIRIIGVAGSVGKSTMRSFLTSILKSKYKVLEGDLNTKLGLTVKIVNELEDQEVMVAELGIDRLGEMKMLTDFIKPDYSIITKLEKEHMQFLESFKKVVAENLVSITNSKNKEGYANILDKELIGSVPGIKYYSADNLLKLSIEWLADHEKDYLGGVSLLLKDKFNFTNSEYEMGMENIQRPKGRLNLIVGENESIIIDDTYNAVCDESVIKGIDYAKRIAKDSNRRLIVIISTMRETGETEMEQHKNVAVHLNKAKPDNLIIIGDIKDLYVKHLKVEYLKYEDSEKVEIKPDNKCLYYIKGSQFFRMEKIVFKLMKDKDCAGDLLVRQDVRWR